MGELDMTKVLFVEDAAEPGVRAFELSEVPDGVGLAALALLVLANTFEGPPNNEEPAVAPLNCGVDGCDMPVR